VVSVIFQIVKGFFLLLKPNEALVYRNGKSKLSSSQSICFSVKYKFATQCAACLLNTYYHGCIFLTYHQKILASFSRAPSFKRTLLIKLHVTKCCLHSSLRHNLCH